MAVQEFNCKAIGMYIFGGSQTIGHLQTGWNVDRILEMTDDMDECNAYHFTKNYPNIPIIKPSIWDNDDYLNCLYNEHYDLLFTNNPCSGLSRINKFPSADNPINEKFFDVSKVVSTIKPKIFFMENAPTLITIGLPIVKRLVRELSNDYFITIITDMAGNHNVPMKRQRTFIIGWNKQYFSKIPIIYSNKQLPIGVGSVLNVADNLPNMEYNINRKFPTLERFYSMVKSKTVLMTLTANFDKIKDTLTPEEYHEVELALNKLKVKSGIWDKSARRLIANRWAPSMTSLSQFIHPTKDRELYVREYARIMGYPDNFIFYQDECKTPIIQCLAQGVPVNFIKYISSELMRVAKTYTTDSYGIVGDVVYQNHIFDFINVYSLDKFELISNIQIKTSNNKTLF